MPPDSAPTISGDAEDHDGHGEPNEGIEHRSAGGDSERAGDNSQGDVCVDASMISVGHESGTVQATPGARAHQAGKPVTGEPDRSSEPKHK